MFVSKLSICEIDRILRDAGMILPEGISLGDVALRIIESFRGRGNFKFEANKQPFCVAVFFSCD